MTHNQKTWSNLLLLALAVVVILGKCGIYDFSDVWEDANWFGKTGLPNDIERELPRYLRREFGSGLPSGEFVAASDLEYMGVYPEASRDTHFWRIVRPGKPDAFAYVEAPHYGRYAIGWGDRHPPGTMP